MILLRTGSRLLSRVIHCDGEWRDSAVECLPNTPWKMGYKGDFFSVSVEAVYQEQVNLATEAKSVNADQWRLSGN